MSQIPNQTPPLPINPDRPIDAVIATLVQDARARNRGFALGVAQDVDEQGKNITFTLEQTLPPADEWEPPAESRRHTVYDVPSLIAMARKYSRPERGLILVDDDGVELVLDELRERGQRETVSLEWEFSRAWRKWDELVNKEPVAHKPLFKFLMGRQGDLADPDILQAMRSVKATATVKSDSTIREIGESVGVVFETAAGEDLVKFPKAFDFYVSVFEDGESQTVPVGVEIVMPQEPRAPVTFLLLAERWDPIRREAIKAELDNLRKALPDWTIVRGTHHTEARKLGRPR